MRDIDVKLADSGAKLHRVAGSSSSKLTDTTYVTLNETDHNRYISLLAPNGGRASTKYDISITTQRGLISPSKKARIDTFIETLSSDIPYGKSTIKGRAFLETSHVDKALSDFELGLKTYENFAQSQVMRTPLHTAYFDRVKSKGYTALVDDADSGLISDIPVILFTDVARATVTSSRKLSKNEIIETQRNLKQL